MRSLWLQLIIIIPLFGLKVKSGFQYKMLAVVWLNWIHDLRKGQSCHKKRAALLLLSNSFHIEAITSTTMVLGVELLQLDSMICSWIITGDHWLEHERAMRFSAAVALRFKQRVMGWKQSDCFSQERFFHRQQQRVLQSFQQGTLEGFKKKLICQRRLFKNYSHEERHKTNEPSWTNAGKSSTSHTSIHVPEQSGQEIATKILRKAYQLAWKILC